MRKIVVVDVAIQRSNMIEQEEREMSLKLFYTKKRK